MTAETTAATTAGIAATADATAAEPTVDPPERPSGGAEADARRHFKIVDADVTNVATCRAEEVAESSASRWRSVPASRPCVTTAIAQ
jgi:hypothetical protein